MHISFRFSPVRARLARALAVLLPAALFPAFLAAPAEARTGYPKVLNIYLSNSVTAQDLAELSKWDVLALDVDFPYENPGAIAELRAMNPEILILGYIPINGPWLQGNLRPPETVAYKHWEGVSAGDFWLYDTGGGIVSDWPGKGSTNLTPNSPVNAQGQQYWEWFAHFVDDVVWQHGASQWDGLFLDDVWNTISWLNTILPYPIDSNRDRVADPASQLDAWWTASNASCTALIRELVGPGVPVMSNGANSCYGSLNGTMIEDFPYNGAPDQSNIYGYAWTRWMLVDAGAYFRGLDNYLASPRSLMTINAKWPGVDDEPDTTGRFGAHKRLGLGSTLLGDGYFSLNNSLEHHSSTWWEPEYDIYLGSPLGPAYTYLVGGLSIWRRDYTEASVVVNPNNATLLAQSGLPTIAGWDAYIGPRILDPPPPDTIAPAEVDTYGGWAVDSRTAYLRWIAVGDDGKTGRAASYQIRYDTGLGSLIYEGNGWEEATVVPNAIEPGWAGTVDSITITGLQPGTWYYFAVRAVDEVGHVGPLVKYNYRIFTPLVDPPPSDIIAPAAITTLVASALDSTRARLEWTAPGDDGASGTATVYHGRIDTAPITDATWEAAPRLFWLPPPAIAGTVQRLDVGALRPSTTYFVALRAEDEVPNLSPLGNVASFTTPAGPEPPPPPPPADITGPSVVADLEVLPGSESILYLRFTAPADSQGTVAAYEIRSTVEALFPDAAWDLAAPVPAPAPAAAGVVQTVAVGGLASSTTYRFRMRSVDDAGNWSALSDTAAGTTSDPAPPPPPPPGDTTPPTRITDLVVIERLETALTLTFTAPADAEGNVAAYDLRSVAGEEFTPALWDSARVVPTGQPSSPGLHEVVRVTGLSPAMFHAFRVRARDDAGNWSELSDPASASTLTPPPPPDTTPPAAILDLAAAVTDTFDVTLTWTAPGDDGTGGQAQLYDLRRRFQTLDASTWASALQVPDVPAPAAAGAVEMLVLTDLPRDITLAFAVVAYDDAGNPGALSNVVTIRIVSPLAPPPPDTQPPGAVEGLAGGLDRPALVALSWAAAPEPDVACYRLYRGRGGVLEPALYRDRLDSCSWEDREVVPGREYVYAVTAVDGSGNEGPRSALVRLRVPVEWRPDLPEQVFAVGEAWPNPSAGRISLLVETGSPVTVSLEVFDIAGRLVRGPLLESLGAGTGEVAWDGCDGSGRRVPRGAYFVRVRGDAASVLRRVWVLP